VTPTRLAPTVQIAPYLEEPSPSLRFLAFLFTVSGSFGVVASSLGAAIALTGASRLPWSLAAIVGYGVSALGLLYTGILLRRRSAHAWWGALLAVAAPLMSAATGHGIAVTQVLFTAAGLVLLAAVRKELE
jgi:hypothetical protein